MKLLPFIAFFSFFITIVCTSSVRARDEVLEILRNHRHGEDTHDDESLKFNSIAITDDDKVEIESEEPPPARPVFNQLLDADVRLKLEENADESLDVE